MPQAQLLRPPTSGGFKKGQSGNPAGRPPGIFAHEVDQATQRRREIAEHLFNERSKNKTPLEHLVKFYNDESQPKDLRLDAAKACLPYVHRKMPVAIEGGDPAKPIRIDAATIAKLPKARVEALFALLAELGVTDDEAKVIEGRSEVVSDDDGR